MTKKVLKGIVTSAKNNKTIVVQVTRKFKHPFYDKIMKSYYLRGNTLLRLLKEKQSGTNRNRVGGTSVGFKKTD